LKTKRRHFKMGQNEPENEAEKCFRISRCGKTNRKTERANPLKINECVKTEQSEGNAVRLLLSSLLRFAGIPPFGG
jgi:hypothetical protein